MALDIASQSSLGYPDLPRLMSLMTGDDKHSASASSTLDVIWVLYDRVLQVAPNALHDPRRDRFLLSKGHGPMAYYAVLAAKGFIPVEALPEFGTFDSILGAHPDRILVPGVEISSGSLGHGLGLAVGLARGLDIRFGAVPRPRVFVLVGDAELDEGSNHEAIRFAGATGLQRLTAIAIDNRSRSHQLPGDLEGLFGPSGWAVRSIAGRDHTAIERALLEPTPGRPLAIVARVEDEQ